MDTLTTDSALPARTDSILCTANRRRGLEHIQAASTATDRAIIATHAAPAVAVNTTDADVCRCAHVRVSSGACAQANSRTFRNANGRVIVWGDDTPKLAVHAGTTHGFRILWCTAPASSIPRGSSTPRRIPSSPTTSIARATRSRPSVTTATSSRRATAAARVAGATRRRAAITTRRTVRGASIATGVRCATVAARSATRAAIGGPFAVAVEVEQATRQRCDQGQQSQRFQIHRHQCPARSQPTSLPRGCKAGVFTDG